MTIRAGVETNDPGRFDPLRQELNYPRNFNPSFLNATIDEYKFDFGKEVEEEKNSKVSKTKSTKLFGSQSPLKTPMVREQETGRSSIIMNKYYKSKVKGEETSKMDENNIILNTQIGTKTPHSPVIAPIFHISSTKLNKSKNIVKTSSSARFNIFPNNTEENIFETFEINSVESESKSPIYTIDTLRDNPSISNGTIQFDYWKEKFQKIRKSHRHSELISSLNKQNKTHSRGSSSVNQNYNYSWNKTTTKFYTNLLKKSQLQQKVTKKASLQ